MITVSIFNDQDQGIHIPDLDSTDYLEREKVKIIRRVTDKIVHMDRSLLSQNGKIAIARIQDPFEIQNCGMVINPEIKVVA